MDTTITASNDVPADQRTTLVFGLGAEEYAIDIALVQELRSYGGVTRLANSPEWVKGVTNLRGVIVPLIDLRIKLALSAPTYDATTVVVILNLGSQTVGIVVDRVADVVSLAPAQLSPPPRVGRTDTADNVLAIATVDERMLILIDMAGLLTDFDPAARRAAALAA